MTIRLLVALALAVGLAHAEKSPIDAQAIRMLPQIEEPVRYKAVQVLARGERQVRQMYQRLNKIDQQLQKDRRNQKLRQQRNQLKKQIDARVAKLLAELQTTGLTDEHFARLRSMPHGRAREQRYNHSVVLEAPGLTEKQLTLLAPLVAGVDGALVALDRTRQQVRQALSKTEGQAGPQAAARINQQFQQTQKQFWRVVYYVLTPEQMRSVRKLFSPRFRYIPQVRESMLQLPGLTPSQATRVTARFVEYETEIAPDQATVRRLNVAMRKKDIAGPDRQKMQREVGASYRRIGALRKDMNAALKEILSQDQYDALQSLPPMLNLGERGRPPFEIIRGMKLRASAHKMIQDLQVLVRKDQRTLQKELQESVQGMGAMAELGPESPQSMEMTMARNGQRGKVVERLRAAGHTLMVEILAPYQVIAWVVAP